MVVKRSKRGSGGKVIEVDGIISATGSSDRTGGGEGSDGGEMRRVGEKRGEGQSLGFGRFKLEPPNESFVRACYETHGGGGGRKRSPAARCRRLA